MNHDWTTSLAALDTPLRPTAFTRPNGVHATVMGSNHAVLLVYGSHNHYHAVGYDDNIDMGTARYTPRKIDTVFVEPPPIGITASVARLRSVIPPEPAVVMMKCSWCNGAGRVECPHCEQYMNCNDCDSTGNIKADPARTLLRVNGYRFNASYLRPLLQAVPDDDIQLATVEQAGNFVSLHLVGNDWRIVAAGLLTNTAAQENDTVIDFPTNEVTT